MTVEGRFAENGPPPVLRWVLAPRWQWNARKLQRAHGALLSSTTAWCLVALAQDPTNVPFVQNLLARRAKESHHPPGVALDCWTALRHEEQVRRRVWLARYGATPLHRLGVPEELIELSGLHVVEWRLPPDVEAASLVVQRRPRVGNGSEGVRRCR
ncbi:MULTISPECIES: hypothetical protein [unclassified Streptomyces]|uniref:hypothetical protein n=1 Tax=unclassified Streptomyces TaxID=2593676 RepID=UPI0006B02EAA|nr:MULTISPECIES: hypothetical protein [unclassified Streptomyces]KOX30824.1 hypothetical protein ADL06_11650 [Streptomyces sp. NRRL F-6491]KOX38858.1 hypothetical protein ADL08_26630 [Streptomyces sp. NRRL F-6492]